MFVVLFVAWFLMVLKLIKRVAKKIFELECLRFSCCCLHLPTKSIPSTSHNTKPRQSAENIQNKKAENPIVPVLHQPPYSSFDDFNKKISLLKLTSYHIQYYASYTKIFKFDHEHSVPFIEISVKNNLDFQIRVYLCEEQLRFPDQGLFV